MKIDRSVLSPELLQGVEFMERLGWDTRGVRDRPRFIEFTRADTGGLHDVMRVERSDCRPFKLVYRLEAYQSSLHKQLDAVRKQWVQDILDGNCHDQD